MVNEAERSVGDILLSIDTMDDEVAGSSRLLTQFIIYVGGAVEQIAKTLRSAVGKVRQEMEPHSALAADNVATSLQRFKHKLDTANIRHFERDIQHRMELIEQDIANQAASTGRLTTGKP